MYTPINFNIRTKACFLNSNTHDTYVLKVIDVQLQLWYSFEAYYDIKVLKKKHPTHTNFLPLIPHQNRTKLDKNIIFNHFIDNRLNFNAA